MLFHICFQKGKLIFQLEWLMINFLNINFLLGSIAISAINCNFPWLIVHCGFKAFKFEKIHNCLNISPLTVISKVLGNRDYLFFAPFKYIFMMMFDIQERWVSFIDENLILNYFYKKLRKHSSIDIGLDKIPNRWWKVSFKLQFVLD